MAGSSLRDHSTLRSDRALVRPGLALQMAVRGLFRSPGITLLGTLVLTLGLAAPTTFFSILSGSTRDLPVPDGDRVIRAEVVQPTRGGRSLSISLEDLSALQGAGTLERLGGFRPFSGTLVDEGRASTRVFGAGLTDDVLPLLRVSPALGRIPGPGEERHTLLLGHSIWMESYEGDPEVLGRAVILDGVPRTIVGILPEGFGFPFKHNAWIYLERDLADQGEVELVGRLAQGVSVEAAASELAGLWSRRDAIRDVELAGGVMQVQGFTGGRGERGEGVAFLGLVAVGLALLLIACSNVANLLLVRATERVKTLAVQAAVGASRLQISVQLLLESLVVAVIGGVGGVFLSWLVVQSLQDRLAAEHFGYYWMRLSIDGRVLAFSAALVGGTAILAGVLPVIRVLKTDLQFVLKEASGGGVVGGGGPWSRRFVMAQLALSCGALVAAGLTGVAMVRGVAFGGVVPAEEVLVATLSGSESQELPPLLALGEELKAIPGVSALALARGGPGYIEPFGPVEVEGEGGDRPQDRRGVIWNAVTPGYFQLFGIGVRSGRTLGPGDGADQPPVAVVSQSFLARMEGSGDPMGKRIKLAGADTARWFTIVGVVEDLDLGGGPRAPTDRVYLPLAQLPSPEVVVLLRSSLEPLMLVSDLRRAVARVDPAIPLWSVRSLADAHSFLTRIPRAMGAMALGGGLAGLLVAAVGLYGLLSFRVRQRRKELGVRLAMGADGPRLARETLRLALRQIVPAMGIGLLLAWIGAPLLTVALFGGDPRSPGVFVCVAVAFTGVGLVAAVPPALRASTVDPATVLRGG